MATRSDPIERLRRLELGARISDLLAGGAGWRTIAAKELADNLLSIRFGVVLLIVALAAVGTVYFSSAYISSVASDASGSPSLFLRLFTVTGDQLPFPFFGLVGFLLPLVGIAFGFDAINSERAQGTLPRLLAQPIHRDDVVNGKFAAGLAVIALIVTAVTAFVAAFGLVRLGITPAGSEVLRIVAWLVVSIVYVGFWLAFASLCSVVLRRAATSALVAFGVWLALSLFFSIFASLVAGVFAPAPTGASTDQIVANAQVEQTLLELSPMTLYQEATVALLDPSVRTVGVVLPSQTDRAVASTLSIDQSLLVVWPQAVALVALTVICFAVEYVVFMRQEVRA
jgi:ABC-2 type transport system permease protein